MVVDAPPPPKHPDSPAEGDPGAQTTESVIMPVEPGRDIFAGNAGRNSKSVSSERVIEPLPKEAVVHTSATLNPGGPAENKLPLPKNEGGQVIGEKNLIEEVHAKEAEAKQKVPAGVQEKVAQAKDNVAEKVAEAKEKLKDEAKAQNDEERVRMELYGNEKREA